MVDAIQETAGTVGLAAQTIIEQGVLGALLIMSVAGNLFLGWRLYNCWKHRLLHAENHNDNQN